MPEQFQLFNAQFPDSIPALYHYTSSGGLLGMLNYKELWLTMLNFSNDAVESTYAVDLIKSVMAEYEYLKYYPTYASDTNPEKRFDDLDLPLVFTFSLSEQGDMLSQWRGYCPNGGYSIRFDPSQVDAMMKENKLSIGKCIYKEDLQRQFIREHIIGLTLNEFKNNWDRNRMNRWFEGFQKQVNSNARRFAPLIKHYKFEEEAEWKIFLDYSPSVGPSLTQGIFQQRQFMKMPDGLLVKGLEFREGKGTLIPYVKVPLSSDKKSVRITELIVSPTPHKDLARVAAQFLLDKNQMNSSTFDMRQDNSGLAKNSAIPYRHW